MPPDATALAISVSTESMVPANDPNTGASTGSATPAPNPAPTDGLPFYAPPLPFSPLWLAVENVLGFVTCIVNQDLVFPTVKPPDLMNLWTMNPNRAHPPLRARSTSWVWDRRWAAGASLHAPSGWLSRTRLQSSPRGVVPLNVPYKRYKLDAQRRRERWRRANVQLHWALFSRWKVRIFLTVAFSFVFVN
jgi:hypothetical protein